MKKKRIIPIFLLVIIILIAGIIPINRQGKKIQLAAAKSEKVNLSDKDIFSIINNAQESFFKVTRSVEVIDNYGILNEEFNSPEKLQKYLNLYWTKSSSKELMNFIGARYIDNKYSITLGDAPYIEILKGEIIKKKQEKDRIYLTIKAYCLDEADNYDFELKLEDNKWVADYFEGSFGVIGKPKKS